MAKKSKSKRIKRLMGVKLPKPVGKFIATPQGQLAMAGAVVAGGVMLARDPRVKMAATMALLEVRRAADSAGQAVGGATRAALAPVIAAMEHTHDGKKGKKNKKTPRMEQADAEASAL